MPPLTQMCNLASQSPSQKYKFSALLLRERAQQDRPCFLAKLQRSPLISAKNLYLPPSPSKKRNHYRIWVGATVTSAEFLLSTLITHTSPRTEFLITIALMFHRKLHQLYAMKQNVSNNGIKSRATDLLYLTYPETNVELIRIVLPTDIVRQLQ